mmetsp:Transcript_26858/g.58394  ORF Transcript_26858/g.58394 Transcript_26858/m.58394 type:complete len:83 (-) Transcript_26858:619-867(-)
MTQREFARGSMQMRPHTLAIVPLREGARELIVARQKRLLVTTTMSPVTSRPLLHNITGAEALPPGQNERLLLDSGKQGMLLV